MADTKDTKQDKTTDDIYVPSIQEIVDSMDLEIVKKNSHDSINLQEIQIPTLKFKSKVDRYTIKTWLGDQGDFIATCEEFPSLSVSAKSRIKAICDIEKVIDDALLSMVENNEKFPEPVSLKNKNELTLEEMLATVPDDYAEKIKDEGIPLEVIEEIMDLDSQISNESSST